MVTRKRQIRMDSTTEQLPATLTAEEEELIKLSQRNTKFERNDLIIPLLKVMQPSSPEVLEGGAQYVPGARPGMFYNTSSGKLTPGQEGMLCCIIGHQRKVMEWIPRTAGGGLVKRWGMDNGWKTLCDPDQIDALNPVTREGHTIDKRREFLIFDIDPSTGNTDPSFFSMRGTAMRIAAQLSNMLVGNKIRLGDGRIITPPYYYFVYKCTLERMTNDQNQMWWLPKFTKHVKDGQHVKTQDMPNGKEIYEQAKIFQEQFLEGTIQQESYEQPIKDELEGDAVTF